MKKPTKTQLTTGLSITGVTAILGMSGALTEHNRWRVANIFDGTQRDERSIVEEVGQSNLSEEQKTLIVKIQTKSHMLRKNIEDNKRFRWFWRINKLPLYWKTSNRLEGIEEILTGDVTINDLRKIDAELKKLIDEFYEIMKEDEQEVIREIQDGIAHITGKEISAIQSYMHECLEIIQNDLTIGGISTDYTGTHGSRIWAQLEEFIGAADSDEARTMLRQLISNYTYMSTEEDSKLALHHLTQIAERLEAGDSWSELIARLSIWWASVAILLLVSFIVIKKYWLPSLGTMGKRLIMGVLAVLWETVSERKKNNIPPPLTDIVDETSEDTWITSADTIDVTGEIIEDAPERGKTGEEK